LYSQLTRVQTPGLTSVCLIKAEFLLSGRRVPVDSEASVVTSLIPRSNPPAQSSGGAHRDSVCVCAFIRVSVYVCI
jgi:hypothetical protein